jgi:hypothetical protein
LKSVAHKYKGFERDLSRVGKAVFNKVIKRFFEILTIRKTNKTLDF